MSILLYMRFRTLAFTIFLLPLFLVAEETDTPPLPGNSWDCIGVKCRERLRKKQQVLSTTGPLKVRMGNLCSRGVNLDYVEKGKRCRRGPKRKGRRKRRRICKLRTLRMPGCKARVSTDFEKSFKNTFKKCVTKAAKEAYDWPEPLGIELDHQGVYNNRSARNSKRKSLHATGRALDINRIRLSFPPFDMGDGQIDDKTIDFTKGTAHPKFYSSFRRCWTNAHPCHRSIGYLGSNTKGMNPKHVHNNKIHHDHLHISYACPPKKGHSSK